MKRLLIFLSLSFASFTQAQTAKAVLSWAPAVDDVSPQTNLLYEIRLSMFPNIATLAEAELNGGAVMPFGAGREFYVVYESTPGSYYYNVVVKDEAGNRAAYKMATVVIPGADIPPTTVAPVITSQPTSVTVKRGQSAIFRVDARGIPDPTFQWRKNGVSIVGAISSVYTTPATLQSDNNALFSVVVSNSAGLAVSSSAVLHVTRK